MLEREVGHVQGNAAAVGIEPVQHASHQLVGGAISERLLHGMQQLQESGHVGAFLVHRQPDEHVDGGDGRRRCAVVVALHRDGETDRFHADTLDREPAAVGGRLDIG